MKRRESLRVGLRLIDRGCNIPGIWFRPVKEEATIEIKAFGELPGIRWAETLDNDGNFIQWGYWEPLLEMEEAP